MEFFLLVMVVSILPALLYVLTAEEVDDALSHKIPAEQDSTGLTDEAETATALPEAADTPRASRTESDPAPATAPIVIDQSTFLGSLLRAIMIICGSILAAALLMRMMGLETLQGWIVGDCIWGFIGAALLSRWVRSRYVIDPVARTILHEDLTPLYVRRRNISFGEIRAVAVRGELTGWPLLYHYHKLVFQTVLVFDSGIVLPVHDPVPAFDALFRTLERERGRARRLAGIIGCPLFPERHLDAASPRRWEAEIRSLRSTSTCPDELEKALIETYLSSLGMTASDAGLVRADLTTRFEKFILAFVVSFSAVTTWYALSAEWSYLASNPRIFYLILLDCTSILVSVFGLWRFLVDEYYEFDTGTSKIQYHSRWLFWKTRRELAAFSDVVEIRINRVWALLSRRLEYVAELRLTGGRRLILSDRAPTPGIPVFRALALARLMGRHLTADPEAFELAVRDAPALPEPPKWPQAVRPPSRGKPPSPS